MQGEKIIDCGAISQRGEHKLKDASMLIRNRRDEYEALFGKGTGPLVLARTDSLVTDGFGKRRLRHCSNAVHVFLAH